MKVSTKLLLWFSYCQSVEKVDTEGKRMKKEGKIYKTLMANITLIFIKSTHTCAFAEIKDYYHFRIIYTALEVANSNLQTTEAITVQIMQMVQQST